MSQDNRLLPLTPGSNIDRPLRDLIQPDKGNNTYSLSEPTHLREYLSVVLKRKWLILSLVVVVTSLVAIQMYRQPTIYRAESTIQIEQKTKNLLRTKEFVINAQNDPAYWGTQLALLENPRLHRKVILALDLQNNPTFIGGQARPSLFTAVRRMFSRQKPSAAPAAASAGQEGGLGVVDDTPTATTAADKLTPEQTTKMLAYEDVLQSNLTIDPVERTNLVKIVYTHTNPELAMKIADTLALVFIQDNDERETSGSAKSAEQLARNITDLQASIRQKQQEIIAFRTSRGLPLGTIQGENLTASILTTSTAQMMEAEAERKKLQAAYEASQNAPDIFSIPVVNDDKSVQELRDKLSTVEEQRQALLVQYTPEWPAVKKLDKQKEQIQTSLDKRARDAVSALRARYEAAVRLENGLRQSNTSARGMAKSQSRSEMELGIIQQELETTQQLYNTAIQKQKELDVAGTDAPSNITISTPARRAEVVGPPRVRNIVIALLLALATGIGLAFLLDYLDDTLKSIEDVDRHIHLPTLALIPAPRVERRFAMPSRSAALAAAGDPTANALALIEEKRSPVAEAYRHLRTSLLLSSAGQPPKTVLVTSSQPSEGKTTTAVNTAVMLAQTGAEVLIIDCDLRRPRIHAHFGLMNTRGVTNYLSGDSNVDGIVQEYEKLPNLKIITSGPVPPNSAELLGSEEMRRLITQLSAKFTHVIIDSPPAISFTDASILSTMVDGVMLVVHGGRSSRAVVRRAKQQLLDVGAHIYGIVLNNVKLESSDYNYYSGYYSSYYANDDEDQTVVAESDEYVETAKSK
ncbi:MAG TPA: polysaccharide biosynthesis tyrosine autokinase [Pyrinomonadaceae bacterium]|jgi:capsular exopolysaccharide synthesis family protein|nr:polysaccharide biosynthesis tyrosine autokinase [Pyrinomonadaceae bacterium]